MGTFDIYQYAASAMIQDVPSSSYQYVIRAQHGAYIKLNESRTFQFGPELSQATLFPTATAAEAAVAYRNEYMRGKGFSTVAPFLIVPVKVITEKVYEFKTTRELA